MGHILYFKLIEGQEKLSPFSGGDVCGDRVDRGWAWNTEHLSNNKRFLLGLWSELKKLWLSQIFKYVMCKESRRTMDDGISA